MLIAASALAIAFSLNAAAQTASPADNPSAQSSSSYSAFLSTDSLLGGDPSAAAGSPQYGGDRRSSSNYPNYESKWSHLAFEGGFGFTAPIGNDTSFSQSDINAGYASPSLAWGWNLNAGVGWDFTKKFGTMIEYQFIRSGMNNDFLNAFSNAELGEPTSQSGLGGNVNTWSFTVDPIYYLPVSHKSGAYVTGGGGFYRKVDNFTEEVEEESYYGVYGVPETVYHFSSNQGGLNFRLGAYRKFSEDSKAKLFAEVGYVWVDSPKPSSSNSYQGSGSEGLIPVTFGVRF